MYFSKFFICVVYIAITQIKSGQKCLLIMRIKSWKSFDSGLFQVVDY